MFRGSKGGLEEMVREVGRSRHHLEGQGRRMLPRRSGQYQATQPGGPVSWRQRWGASRTLASTVRGIIVYDEHSPADKIHRVSMRKESSSLRVPHSTVPQTQSTWGDSAGSPSVPVSLCSNPAGLLAAP